MPKNWICSSTFAFLLLLNPALSEASCSIKEFIQALKFPKTRFSRPSPWRTWPGEEAAQNQLFEDIQKLRKQVRGKLLTENDRIQLAENLNVNQLIPLLAFYRENLEGLLADLKNNRQTQVQKERQELESWVKIQINSINKISDSNSLNYKQLLEIDAAHFLAQYYVEDEITDEVRSLAEKKRRAVKTPRENLATFPSNYGTITFRKLSNPVITEGIITRRDYPLGNLRYDIKIKYDGSKIASGTGVFRLHDESHAQFIGRINDDPIWSKLKENFLNKFSIDQCLDQHSKYIEAIATREGEVYQRIIAYRAALPIIDAHILDSLLFYLKHEPGIHLYTLNQESFRSLFGDQGKDLNQFMLKRLKQKNDLGSDVSWNFLTLDFQKEAYIKKVADHFLQWVQTSGEVPSEDQMIKDIYKLMQSLH